MIDIEIPQGKRSKSYRFFEMVPAILSYGSILLLVLLSIVSPLAAAIYLMLIIITMVVKAIGIAIHTISGRKRLQEALAVDWHARLQDLESPAKNLVKNQGVMSREFGYKKHIDNLQVIAADQKSYPKPSDVYNAVIIATYNESVDVIEPTIKSVIDNTYDTKHIILVLAYEERGGPDIQITAELLQKRYGSTFKEFYIVKHPSDIDGEVIGKGGNITYAGIFLKSKLEKQGIPFSDVIVTTLDSDNRPHAVYFDSLTYEFITHKDRKHLAFQPISLFLNNIWDAPAPMRVVATGNSFWNIISSMRPHTLRNFASHSQPMDALVEMNFWSTRTIVEDGHQYWRSYFHFNGDYSVVPVFVPIYQDAVMSDTYGKTLKAQFIQMRRWAYGASDIPYVATRIFSKYRNVPFWGGIARLTRLVDGHITLAAVAILISVGGWVPLIVNSEATHSIAAHQLPEVIGNIQKVAMIGLFITVYFSFKMLPPRPERYKRTRSVSMLLQWILMPITSIVYGSLSSLVSQGRLFSGRYLDKFDVTEKATVASVERAKKAKADRVSSLKK